MCESGHIHKLLNWDCFTANRTKTIHEEGKKNSEKVRAVEALAACFGAIENTIATKMHNGF